MRRRLPCRAFSIVRHPELVEKWVEIGLYAVLLGLEGGCDRTLQNVNKSCRVATNDRAIRILQDHGVIIWGAFIVDPDWTEEDFKLLRDYVSRREITHTHTVYGSDPSARDAALPGPLPRTADGRLLLF